MKLVEILARELKEWPEGARCARQSDETRKIYFYGAKEDKHDFDFHVFAEDAGQNVTVTRTQWEEERARVLAESQPERDADVANVVDAGKSRNKEDQALWDKVAIASTQAFITAHVTHFGHENVWESKELVSCAADYADAFMAERAKRLDNSHTTSSTT